MRNDTQQVRVRADVIPSLKTLAARRGSTLSALISEAVVDWLSTHDPTWKDTLVLSGLRSRLAEVEREITKEHDAIVDFEDALEHGYVDDEQYHTDTDEARKEYEGAKNDAVYRRDDLLNSRERLIAAVVALSGDSREEVEESLKIDRE